MAKTTTLAVKERAGTHDKLYGTHLGMACLTGLALAYAQEKFGCVIQSTDNGELAGCPDKGRLSLPPQPEQ